MITFEPKKRPSMIKVIGVGGGGSNAVNYMFRQGIEGVDFVVCNTDLQALEASPVPIKIQLGNKGGLGAGSKPEVGKIAANESVEKLREVLRDDTKMLFITAGMGGGTGTGAAPIIAEIAREIGILTVGIVTLPFIWEGRKRRQQAEAGVLELRKHIDTLLVISNDKLREEYGDLQISHAFAKADNVLSSAAKGIAELITVPGYINIDFEDVKTVIENSGKAIMGSATAEGEGRALKAIEDAMSSKLLDDNDIKGARNILLYIMTGNDEITMDEITEITDYVQQECGGEYQADVIWGNGKDESLGNKIGITIIATGFESKKQIQKPPTIVIGGVGGFGIDQPKNTDPVIIKPETPEIKTEPAFEIDLKYSKIIFEQPHDEIISKPELDSPAQPSETSSTHSDDQNLFTKIYREPNDDLKDTPAPETKKPEIKITQNENKNLAIKYTIGAKTEDHHFEPAVNQSNLETDDNKRNANDRINKLKNQSFLSNKPDMITQLENEPAYKRKNIEITEPSHSSDSIVSRYTLGEDSNNNPVIKSDNSFLHDNVD